MALSCESGITGGEKGRTWGIPQKAAEIYMRCEHKRREKMSGTCLSSSTMAVASPVPIPNGLDLPPPSRDLVTALRFSTGLILPPPEIKCKFCHLASFTRTHNSSSQPSSTGQPCSLPAPPTLPNSRTKLGRANVQTPSFPSLIPSTLTTHTIDTDSIALLKETSVMKPYRKTSRLTVKCRPLNRWMSVWSPPKHNSFWICRTLAQLTCMSYHTGNISATHTSFRDIMKLTALFTARRGRNFLATLSAREGRNYQFDFLRPTHSLFPYFNRLVEQYTRILHPDREMLEQLKERTKEGARWKTLEVANRYAKWERTKREKDQKRRDDEEAERST